MLFTIKELAHRSNRDELMIRQIVTLFGIKTRGEGPKPARGRSPALYNENDLKRAFEIIDAAKAEFAAST